MRRLSSGLRVDAAADDAAGLGISEKMRAQIRGLEQATRNAQDGISALNTMDGILAEATSIMHRARELAVQYNNRVYSTQDRLRIFREMVQLSNEIGRLERNTTFNGKPLLQSFSSLMTLQVGANDNETMTISMVDMFGPTGLVRPNVFLLSASLPANINGIDAAINDLSTARARLGAQTNRLEHTINANLNAQEHLMSAESRIRDLDVAAEMTQLVKQQLLQQTGAQVLTKASGNPQRVLELLRQTYGG